MSGDYLDKFRPGAVADAKPDDLGRVSVKQTALMKVGVLRDDREAVGACILPNVIIGEAEQPALANMRAVGNSVASKRGSLGERFSSKSNFMWDDVQATITVCGEGEARLNVVGGQVGEVVQHLGNGHAAPQVIEHVGHGNAGASDARLATADARIYRNVFSVVHTKRLVFLSSRVKKRKQRLTSRSATASAGLCQRDIRPPKG